MKRVFVSGCFDVFHAGHVRFFEEARSLGDHLTVSVASEEALWLHKRRRPSIPDEHKHMLIGSLSMVDEVVMGTGCRIGLDFEEDFRRLRPDILAVNSDDPFIDIKTALCKEIGCRLVVMESSGRGADICSSSIARWMQAPEEAPLRVDFAGGWLDVPKYSRENSWIVNCAISPMVSLRDWPYQKNAGLGGSGAWALLNGRDGVNSELDLGVGWQDPAVIRETGACVWQSGARPVLEFKSGGAFLTGCLALMWTGKPHDTPGIVGVRRDFDMIARAGCVARQAVKQENLQMLGEAIHTSYVAQLDEGMLPLMLPAGALSTKYCGGGHGGYAVILFPAIEARAVAMSLIPDLIAIEPYCRFGAANV